MRSLVLWMIVGSFVGSVAATMVAPSVLETLLATTGAKDAMCQCSELVTKTSVLLIRTQIWGAGIGAVVFGISSWLLRRRFGSKVLPAATPVETR